MTTPAEKAVLVLTVESSDASKPPYLVRLEDGEPLLCTCKGFVYRLSCRHLAIAKAQSVRLLTAK